MLRFAYLFREESRLRRAGKPVLLRPRQAYRPEVAALEGRALLSVIYSNNFQTGSTAGWSSTPTPAAITTSPNATQKFLGEFGNDTVTLSLTDTAPHTQITVDLDLYI